MRKVPSISGYDEKPNIISVKCTEMVLLCTHDKKYRVSSVGFMSIAFFFFKANRCPKTNTHCPKLIIKLPKRYGIKAHIYK
jgi:hypothetical protein